MRKVKKRGNILIADCSTVSIYREHSEQVLRSLPGALCLTPCALPLRLEPSSPPPHALCSLPHVP